MTETQAIDFEKMKQEALAKANKVFTFKHASREDLFNILQDMRHLVMFDLRPKQEYYAWHIRNSYCVEEAQNSENDLIALMEDLEKKYAAEEGKSNTKPIRRAFIINTNQKAYSESDPATKLVLDSIKKYGGFDKVYNLKLGLENFSEKYPFLCINLNERDQAKLEKKDEESKSTEKPILNEFEKKWLYSLSRFPTEIIEGKLYLGSVHNANNKKQMHDLKIKSIIEFISYGEQKVPEDKINNYNYKNIPVDKDTIFCIDFDEICKYIDELLADQSKGPLLIACRDGDTISPCFATAYLMWHKKASLTIASVTVFQKRGTVDANKQLYTVLSTWQPKGGENKGGLSGLFAR